MKKYLCLILIWSYSIICIAQIERQWTSELDNEGHNIEINSAHLERHYCIFNQVIKDENYKIISNKLEIYDVEGGDEVWSFNWSDYFTLNSRIKLLPIDSNQMYFVVNDSHANRPDYYGVIKFFEGIVWQDAVILNSSTNIALIENKLLIDISVPQGKNKLLLVNDTGNIQWILEDGDYKAWNRLVSIRNGNFLWMNNNGLTIIDSMGQIISKTNTKYAYSYSYFEASENELFVLTWDPFFFIAKKYSNNNLLECEVDTMDYAYDIFGVPNPIIETDKNGNVYFSSDYTYEGNSFIAKYNINFDQVWVREFDEPILNVYEKFNWVIIVCKSSIKILDKQTGGTLMEEVFGENAKIHGSQKGTYDSKNNLLYVFTYIGSNVYLNQYKLNIVDNTMDAQNKEGLIIYPIPVLNKLYFSGNNNFDYAFIYSLEGQLIFHSKLEKGHIDVESLTAGMYIIKFINPFNSFTSKFVKM